MRLKNDSELKEKIAANGDKYFQENLTEKKIGEKLLKVIQDYA